MKLVDIRTVETTHGTYLNFKDLKSFILRFFRMYPCRPLLTLLSLLERGTHAKDNSSNRL